MIKDTKLKISVIATTGIYPLHIGGPGNVGYFLTKQFASLGHNVILLVRVRNKAELELLNNSREFLTLKGVIIIPVIMDYNIKTFINIPYIFIQTIKTAYNFLKNKPDVVLYNSPPVDISVLIPFICKLYSINQYFIFHGGLFNESRNIIGRWLIKVQLNHYKKVIAISSYSTQLAMKVGVKEKNITVINNGVDLNKYKYLQKIDIEGDPKILYVGRLEKIKGIHVLIKAFHIVFKQLPSAHLYIVGNGSEMNNCVELATKLNVNENIHFIGYIPPSEKLYQFYNTCDMLILPSFIENFPITLLEAMYFKLPVISTNIKGGITEIIKDGLNGLLVEPGNYMELANTIVEFSSNKGQQNLFAEFNYSLLNEKYTWNIIADKYIDLFLNE